MATISTADFKNGMGLKINDKYYTIVEFQHVKPGKGGAFVRYKIRDLKTGRVIDQTCNAGTKFENVQLITKEMQYLYNDGATFYFMDNETYEQVELSADFIGDNAKWFKENDNAQLLYADTELLGVQPPMFIEVEITETDPGFKGDTVQGGSKPATIETGAVIQVPLYLNVGETIKVDTRDGGRARNRDRKAAPGDRGGFLVPGLRRNPSGIRSGGKCAQECAPSTGPLLPRWSCAQECGQDTGPCAGIRAVCGTASTPGSSRPYLEPFSAHEIAVAVDGRVFCAAASTGREEAAAPSWQTTGIL